ncbi:TrmJ/YjtD family RNA methyltransferase [Blastochloris viridis]|uniref:tRNA (cytidine/uridine-2'-O-)-methyltransferase TrmJ n=1 Tax=Blastochloris viridis TaxID=1079 RepID=A0A0H5B6U4_BLAVI|nr:TrmJ/YjtD family RNA methyltransferase [Blastochloris viridis]ALK08810.1 tRNA (cytidine/uridine-2'-O-)-methyltransferase TrmJ [Blastochloris viridis]BAR97890.1 tRNA:Cm32/Um32 methyltransferase [Blastochloris viridis]CUU41471.1 tRNA (cytidine/uridine-2'-O-)-methyltransferase TrmJ [Blastochloris viridis]
MSGTDQSRPWLTYPAPAIVLVEPQMGENIGTTARAMANFGLSDLRLVAPRDGWPNPRAKAAASGADSVLESAQVFPDLRAAIADLGFVVAATARSHTQAKPVLGPEAAAKAITAKIAGGAKAGVVFGRERNGLESDEVGLADAIVTYPVNPAFASLNLAQAVLLMAYEVSKLAPAGALPHEPLHPPEPAPREQLHAFFDRLEFELERVEFFRPPEKRPVMSVNLRNIILRMAPTRQDVQTLSGVIDALVSGRKGPAAGGVLNADEAVSLRSLVAAEATVGVTAPVRGLARLVRRNPTEAERAVWTNLVNDRRLAGRGYKRRVPIGPHIVDFVSFPEKTVLELDDGTEEPAVAARRRAWLVERGYRVVLLPEAGLTAEALADRLVAMLAPVPSDAG